MWDQPQRPGETFTAIVTKPLNFLPLKRPYAGKAGLLLVPCKPYTEGPIRRFT